MLSRCILADKQKQTRLPRPHVACEAAAMFTRMRVGGLSF